MSGFEIQFTIARASLCFHEIETSSAKINHEHEPRNKALQGGPNLSFNVIIFCLTFFSVLPIAFPRDLEQPRRRDKACDVGVRFIEVSIIEQTLRQSQMY